MNGYPEVLFQIMDGRYHSDPDRSICLCVEEKIEQAKKWLKEWPDAVIVKVTKTDELSEDGLPIYGNEEIV